MGPPITLFLTTIASQVDLRRRQEFLLRIFQLKRIPFQAYDMASDEQARRLWKRKVPPAKQALPGILVDTTFVGTVEEFEAAVEQGDPAIRKFLRMDVEYNAELERAWATPAPEVVPIGVPGVQMPSEISGHKTVFHGPKDKPVDKSKVVKHDAKLAEGEIDLTESLGDFGLEGVTVTEDELAELVASLGLEDRQADELLKGITEASSAANPVTDDVPQPGTAAEPSKPKSTSKPKAATSSTPPPPTAIPPIRPTVTIDTAAVPTSDALAVPETPLSAAHLTPTGIMSSREVMSELAKKVEAKRRSRTDAKPRRIPSLSPLSETATPILESPLELPPADATEKGSVSPAPTPARSRKPSLYESSKPKVAFPVTDTDTGPDARPYAVLSSPSPQTQTPATRERKLSAMGGPPSAQPGTPAKRERKLSAMGGPPSAFPSSELPTQISRPPSASAIPVRERKRSGYSASKPKLPTPAGGSSVPPLPNSATKDN